MKKRSGFTLAEEVLLTLGVVGVVAALTIISVIENTQKQEYLILLKQAFTEVNQALAQMAIDKGCLGDLKCTGLFVTGTGNSTLGDEIVKYFKVIKNCRETSNAGCFAAATNAYYDGTSASSYAYDTWGGYRFVTESGMSFNVGNSASNCASSGTNVHGYSLQTCGRLIVDVNGLKPPNFKGRDTFQFSVTNGKGPLLYPQGGVEDTGDYWNYNGRDGCSPSFKWGNACAGRIIEKGWVMDY